MNGGHLHRFTDTGRVREERNGALRVQVPVRACECGEER